VVGLYFSETHSFSFNNKLYVALLINNHDVSRKFFCLVLNVCCVLLAKTIMPKFHGSAGGFV